MPKFFIPVHMKQEFSGVSTVTADAATVGELFDEVERTCPGMKARIWDQHQLRTSLALVVDGNVSTLGRRQTLKPDSEVHIVPAIGGG